MKRASGRIKWILTVTFTVAAVALFLDRGHAVRPVEAFSDGPPVGHTGAPGESTCIICHSDPGKGGEFTITAPQNYVPGQTYQIVVTHVNPDVTRRRWGFQLTALNATNMMAGTFANLNANTQVVGGVGRDYIQHTGQGTFPGQAGGAMWGFNWTAPATNIGPVTFYAAGNQANNDGTTSGDRIITATASSQAPADPVNSHFDFDGDGKTDIGIFRPGPAEWWIRNSGNSQVFAAQFGATTDVIAPADFTGDGKADVAFWRPSTGFWFILRSEDFSFFAFPFGSSGDIPVPADYDGDEIADATVFRPSASTWFISRSTGGTGIIQFGAPGDQPIPADYDGDGETDLAIRRPNGPNGAEWWLSRSTAGVLAIVFGGPTDHTVHADYTGDGKADVAFWRPSTGGWFILRSEDLSFYSVPFGSGSDIPVPGDYDGDGKSDTAIFRPSETNWYIDRSTAGILIQQFGAAGDRPIPNAFVHQ